MGGRTGLSSDSSILTVGVTSLRRVLRTKGLLVSNSGSVSVSDGRACLVELVRPPVALRLVEVSVSSDEYRPLFLAVRFGVGGGGIRLALSVSSSVTVPSWLLGISVMPLLVRLVLERAASIFLDRGMSSWAKISISCGFLAEAG